MIADGVRCLPGNKWDRKWLIIKPRILALPAISSVPCYHFPESIMVAPLVIARHEDNELALLPALANRHGLITGATGTGKTITLQLLAERFSAIGVPVFMADVKGDLSGLAAPGSLTPKLQARLDALGVSDYAPAKCPVTFWDVFGAQGHPVRATISDMGPVLLRGC
jgi:hypothetical protein